MLFIIIVITKPSCKYSTNMPHGTSRDSRGLFINELLWETQIPSGARDVFNCIYLCKLLSSSGHSDNLNVETLEFYSLQTELVSVYRTYVIVLFAKRDNWIIALSQHCSYLSLGGQFGYK